MLLPRVCGLGSPAAGACPEGARGQRGRCGDAHGAPSSVGTEVAPAPAAGVLHPRGESQCARPRPRVRGPCLRPRGHQSTRGSLAGGRPIQKDVSRDGGYWEDLSKVDGGVRNQAWTRARSICALSWGDNGDGGTVASGCPLRLKKHHLFQAPSTLHRSQILRRKRLIGFSVEGRKQCRPAPPRPHTLGSDDPRREEGVALHISDTSLKRETDTERQSQRERERPRGIQTETETERQS